MELFYYWSHTFETWYIYVKHKFEIHLFLDFFNLVTRKQVIQIERNFQTVFELIISPSTLKLEQWLSSLGSESLTLQMLWYVSCDFFCFFVAIFLFRKSTHISHNISESQNAFHDIYCVKDSERNKKEPIVLTSKLYTCKRFHSRISKLSEEYKQTPVSVCVCV